MHRNKFITTFLRLPSKTAQGFQKYSNRLYTKTSAANLVLQYLHKLPAEREDYLLEGEYVFSKIFKNEVFSKKKLNNALSDLSIRLDEFLIKEYFKENTIEKNIILVKKYEELRLMDVAENKLKIVERKIESNEEESLDFWMNNFRFSHINYFNSFSENNNPKRAVEIANTLSSLDNFHALAKLRYTCVLLSRNQILQEPLPEINFNCEALTCNYSEVSIIHSCYQAAFKLLNNKTDKNYHILSDVFFSNIEKISQNDKLSLITYLLNYCSMKIKEGDETFKRIVFDVYQKGIMASAFFANEIFNDMHFCSIVDMGCQMQKYEWSKNFTLKWSQSLSPLLKEEVKDFCNAFIFHAEKRYKEALNILVKNDFKQNVFYGIRARRLEIICMHEAEKPIELIDARCEAFRQYARRRKDISNDWEVAIISFLNIFNQLQDPNISKEKLLSIIEKSPRAFYRNWLIEKVNNTK